MARFAKKHPLLLMILLLVCTVTLISCGQGSNSSVSTSSPTSKQTICASCITVSKPSLKALGQSTNSIQSIDGIQNINGIQGTNDMQYQLAFVITNSGEATLSKFEVDLKTDAQTATTTDSNSQTITNSTTVPGHSQFTYQVGDPNDMDSGISLPNPPPPSVHMKITVAQNGTTLASWDGQVNVPT